MKEKTVHAIFTKLSKRIDRKFMVFLLFVFVSSIFWFLSKLENEYESDIHYPIRFVNIPEDKVLVGDLPDHLRVTVRAQGQQILKYKVSNTILPQDLNIQDISLRFLRDSNIFYALSRDFRHYMERKFPSEVRIIDINPDTIYFDLNNRVWKKVKVVTSGNISTAKQYMVKKIEIVPDSVIVSGPSSIIDTIRFVSTELKDINEISENFQDEIELNKIKRVDFNANDVRVFIQVEQFTEASIKVPLRIENTPDSIIIRTFPNQIDVTYFVALSDYEKVFPRLFDIQIDYNTIITDENALLQVKMLNYPEYVSNVRFSPKVVDYIIEIK